MKFVLHCRWCNRVIGRGGGEDEAPDNGGRDGEPQGQTSQQQQELQQLAGGAA